MTSVDLGTPLRLDHLAIWVEDMEKTADFLTNVVGFRRHPMLVEVSEEDLTTGGMEAVFVDGNGLWLEMILPTSPGPGMEILEQLGDGAIVEVNFEAVDDDYRKVLDDMAARGIQMLSMDGSPLVDGGRIKEGVAGNDASAESGQYIAYWPTELSSGTTIEVYEKVSDDSTNLLNIRDRDWQRAQGDGPRIDRVTILVEDLERAADFYTDILGLRRHGEIFDVADDSGDTGGMRTVFIAASHLDRVWIQLIEPTTAGPLRDKLTDKGNGHVLEVAIEVDDLAAYIAQQRARGVSMVDFSGNAVPEASAGNVIEPYGDRYCYFPPDISRGMRIAVSERGPIHSSMLHQRDSNR